MPSLYFKVWPEEAELLANANKESLVSVIRDLQIEPKKDKMPLHLLLPHELLEALEDVTKLGYMKIPVLLNAARQYRDQNPWQSEWSEDMMSRNDDLPYFRSTVRVDPDDFELLRNIGKGRVDVKNAYEAFIHIAKIIRSTPFADVTKRKRISVYFPLSDELSFILNAKHRESKIPIIRILLQAIEIMK